MDQATVESRYSILEAEFCSMQIEMRLAGQKPRALDER